MFMISAFSMWVEATPASALVIANMLLHDSYDSIRLENPTKIYDILLRIKAGVAQDSNGLNNSHNA